MNLQEREDRVANAGLDEPVNDLHASSAGVDVGSADYTMVIRAGVTMDGNLAADHDVVVEGRFEGRLTCRALTIAPEGIVRGTIIADSVRSSGTIVGRVDCQKILVRKSGSIEGTITCARLGIEPGADVKASMTTLVVPEVQGVATPPSVPVINLDASVVVPAGSDGSGDLKPSKASPETPMPFLLSADADKAA
jgi:cytoskeletal protein CcmA (bactofilin family)